LSNRKVRNTNLSTTKIKSWNFKPENKIEIPEIRMTSRNNSGISRTLYIRK
jgi:TFIIF-interacting CTD phosphatase-like protein